MERIYKNHLTSKDGIAEHIPWGMKPSNWKRNRLREVGTSKSTIKKLPVISIKPWTNRILKGRLGWLRALQYFTAVSSCTSAPSTCRNAASNFSAGIGAWHWTKTIHACCKVHESASERETSFLSWTTGQTCIMPMQLHPSDVWKVSHCWPRWRHGWHWWCSACYRIPWRCSMQLAPNVFSDSQVCFLNLSSTDCYGPLILHGSGQHDKGSSWISWEMLRVPRSQPNGATIE